MLMTSLTLQSNQTPLQCREVNLSKILPQPFQLMSFSHSNHSNKYSLQTHQEWCHPSHNNNSSQCNNTCSNNIWQTVCSHNSPDNHYKPNMVQTSLLSALFQSVKVVTASSLISIKLTISSKWLNQMLLKSPIMDMVLTICNNTRLRQLNKVLRTIN